MEGFTFPKAIVGNQLQLFTEPVLRVPPNGQIPNERGPYCQITGILMRTRQSNPSWVKADGESTFARLALGSRDRDLSGAVTLAKNARLSPSTPLHPSSLDEDLVFRVVKEFLMALAEA